jgi:hypothetical protein
VIASAWTEKPQGHVTVSTKSCRSKFDSAQVLVWNYCMNLIVKLVSPPIIARNISGAGIGIVQGDLKSLQTEYSMPLVSHALQDCD